MAEATQNSAAPKPAIAQTNINSTREDQVKADALKQAHDFELSSGPEDRYDLTHPGSVPPDVNSAAFEDGKAAPHGAGASPALTQEAKQPANGAALGSSGDADGFSSAQESASFAPPTNSVQAGPPGSSSGALGKGNLPPAGPAAPASKGGGESTGDAASVSADEVPPTAMPTAFAEQAGATEKADAAEQPQPGGQTPAPVDGTPPPVPVNEAPTALNAELSPIAENSEGHIIVGRLTTADPDGQDSHSYEIVGGHPLFEIDGDAITLKPGAQLNYETRDSYDLEIRSTDGAGNSIVKTVTVNVTDVNEAPTASAIGDHTASAGDAFTLDTSSHFADVDHGDTLTYSIDGPEWMSIDPATGVISGTPPAHLVAHELTSDAHGGYGLPQSGVIQIDAGVTFSESAYSNSFGYYLADADGKPFGGIIVENNAHELGGGTTLIDLAEYPGAVTLGFFVIPNGAQNAGLTDGEKVTFSFEGGQWHASADGVVLHGAGADIFFSNPTLNADGVDHLGGNGNWEDLVGGGDRDYQDVIADVSVKSILAEPGDAHAPVTVTVTDSGGLTAHSSFDLNVQPSPVTIDDIENHTYDPTGSVVDAGPTGIQLADPGIAENSAAGTVVGHLSSVDANVSDSHSYEIVDGHPLFEISGDAIMLKAGAQLDYETQNGYDLEIRSTDEAGNSVVKTVTVNVTDVNEAPDATAIAAQTAMAGGAFSLDTSSHFTDVDHGDTLTYSIDGPEWLSIDPATGVISGTPPGHMAVQELTAGGNGHYDLPSSGVLQLNGHVLSSNAGYNNSVGYYLADASGNPLGGAVFEDNAHNLGESIAQIDLAEYPGAATLGFFIIPNGNQNAASTDGEKVEFQFSDGQWHASANGVQLAGTGAGVFFSDTSLNAKGYDYLVDNNVAGNMNWEDLLGGGDKDFDDVSAQVSLKAIQLVPDTDHATVTVTVTDKGGLTAQSSFDLNMQPGEQLAPYTISGTDHSEGVYGTEQGDTITALGGNDIVRAYGGDDTVLGGDGNDLIFGEAGNDTIYGGAGNDVVSGGAGNDIAYLGAGDDTFDTINGNRDDGDGADTVYGEAGNDTIYGGGSDDLLDGGDGNDKLYGEAGNDVLLGGAGDDYLDGSDGGDQLIGGDGNDKLYGGDGNDVVSGGAGNDIAYLGAGDDTFDTVHGDRDDGDGADTVYGEAGNDTIWGGGSDDKLYGGDGNDYVNGEAGNDTLYGDAGDDVLDGDIGNDYLAGGDGSDQLYGGAGNDTLVVDASDIVVQGGDGTDKAVVSGSAGVTLDLAASSIERAEGGVGDDVFDASGATGPVIEYGNAGNDMLTGGAGADSLYGGDGNDVVSGGAGNDIAYLGAGDDTFDTTHGDRDDGDGADTVRGEAGNDTIWGGGSDDKLYGGDGNDYVNGEAGNDTLYGDAGDDVLDGDIGNDYLAGGEGSDQLYGGAGNDTLVVDASDTVVQGGDGTDKVTVSGTAGVTLDLAASSIERAEGGVGDDIFDASGATAAVAEYGNAGDDTLIGGAGNDVLDGGIGNDTLYGGGQNLLINGSFENPDITNWQHYSSIPGWTASVGNVEVLDNAVGVGTASDGHQFMEIDANNASVDRVHQNVQTQAGQSFTLSLDTAARVNTALATNTVQVYWNGVLLDSIDPASTSWESHSFTVVGTGGLDQLEFREVSGDNDSYGGLIDNVSLLAASGNDTLTGGEGNDSLFGGAGNDVLTGGAGVDRLYGGAGNDTLVIDASDTVVQGGDGTDKVTVSGTGGVTLDMAASSIERAEGGVGNDVFNASGAITAVTQYGNAGDDTLTGGAGADYLHGGVGADQLYGGAGDDTLVVDADDTVIQGGDGSDKVIVTGTGGVTLDMAASSVERAEGGVGNDVFNASSAVTAVTQYGNAGDDMLTGGAGNDYLNAGDGNDVVSGGAGNDNVYLGAGDDIFDTTNGDADIGDGADTVRGEAGNDLIYGGGSDDALYGGTGNDRLYGEAGNDKLYGEAGDDLLNGGDGNDTLDGGDGNDQLYGEAGNDTLNAGAGNDVVSGGAGNDIARLGDGDDIFDTTNGDADLDDGADTVHGEGGHDLIYGGGSDDKLYGGEGNDRLYGEAGNDTLFGGTGDDILFGMEGNDIMNGEDGSDLFMFSADSGMDAAHGGVGGGWVDAIRLTGAGGAGSPGAFGTDWTLQLTSGHIVSQDEHNITLSDDADGFITFDNHNQLSFTDMERIEC